MWFQQFPQKMWFQQNGLFRIKTCLFEVAHGMEQARIRFFFSFWVRTGQVRNFMCFCHASAESSSVQATQGMPLEEEILEYLSRSWTALRWAGRWPPISSTGRKAGRRLDGVATGVSVRGLLGRQNGQAMLRLVRNGFGRYVTLSGAARHRCCSLDYLQQSSPKIQDPFVLW